MSYSHARLSESNSSPRHSIHSIHSNNSDDDDNELKSLESSEGPSGSGSSRAMPMHRRNSTLSNFALPLMSLTLSSSEETERGEPVIERTVGLSAAVALVVGSQIGSGIFSAPGVVVADVRSVGASLTVWLISGILAWTGASSFAELGSMIPLNGGAQAYLAYSYGPLVSYLYTWTAISLLKPCSAAIIALIFGEYLCRIMFHVTSADALPNELPQWAIKLTAWLAMFFVTLINLTSNRLGSRANLLFTVLKVGALVAVLVLGLITLARRKESTSLTEPIFAGTSSNPSSFALALYSGLWAFDGWDQSNMVAGELKNAEKTLPRVIHISMALVVTLYLAANIAYFAVLDKSIVMLSNTVAMDFGRALFGSFGAVFFSVVVAVSSFGALSAGTFTTARVIYVAGREGYLPAPFGRLHTSRKTPLNALLLNLALTTLFIIFGGGFRTLINVLSVAEWGFYFLTVVGLLVLRVKEPGLERPYRTWIGTPLIFSAVALFLLCMPVFAAPIEALAALGFILVGVPLYYATRQHHVGSYTTSRRSGSDGDDSDSLSSRISSFFSALGDRIRGRSPAAARTSTYRRAENEETVEMLEASDRR